MKCMNKHTTEKELYILNAHSVWNNVFASNLEMISQTRTRGLVSHTQQTEPNQDI